MQLDLKDAAGIFDVPEKTIHRWIKQKGLPAYELDEQFRFNRAELLEWATEHKITVSSEIMNDPEDGEVPPPRLDEALRLGGVCHNVEGTDKASVLGAVVEIMHLPEDVDRTVLYEVLLARESLGSTGIGEGIAIPHVRHPIVLHTLHPTITLCFLKYPIDFGAVDGEPVNILFTLVSPTVHAHQHLLSKLAFALKDPQFKAVLARRGSCEEILKEAGRIEKSISLHSSS
jgi:PTS system nitrogen regulatory IIA component